MALFFHYVSVRLSHSVVSRFESPPVLILILATALLAGCTSNLYLQDSSKPGANAISPMVVSVTNPDHRHFEVLKRSGIFEVRQSGNSGNTVTILESLPRYVCGNGLIPSMMTLGILPGYAMASETIVLDVQVGHSVERKEYFIGMYERYSMWEWLFKPFRPNDIDLMARGLKMAAQNDSPN